MKELLKKIGVTDFRHILAFMYVFLCLAYIYVLAFEPVPERNRDLINILGGSVIGGLGLILAYYFGSSKKDKPNN